MNYTQMKIADLTFAASWSPHGLRSLRIVSNRKAPTAPYSSNLNSPLLRRALRAVVAGKTSPRIPFDWRDATDFQKKVWRELQKIPRGKTRCYAEIARRIGKPKAARAVGAACGANPIIFLVPCHRVIASNGSLGGFSCGLALKRKLLAMEKAKL